MERKIQGRTASNSNFLYQYENSSTNLTTQYYSDVGRYQNLNTSLEAQIISNENSITAYPSNHQENVCLMQQNNITGGYQTSTFQMSLQSSNFSEYRQLDGFQMDNHTTDYSGYQLQSHGEDHHITNSSQLHNPSDVRAHQNVHTSGNLQDEYFVDHLNATTDEYGLPTSPTSNEVHRGCKPKKTSKYGCRTSPSPLWELPAYQNVTGEASLPSYSYQSHSLQTSLSVEPHLVDLYGNQQPHNSLPHRTMERHLNSHSPSSFGNEDANLFPPPQQAGCSSSIYPSSLFGSPKQQTSLPRFKEVFGFCSEQIADTGNVATFTEGAVVANPPCQHDAVASQKLSYTQSSFDNDNVLDLFTDKLSIDEFDRKTRVNPYSTQATGSPTLNEPHRVERTSFSLDSPSSGTLNSPFSEIFDSPSSEPLYSPSSEALDSPSSDVLYSPIQNTPDSPSTHVSPSTHLPSGSGVVPKRPMRAPRNVSTSSSQSSASRSSSTNSSASSQKGRIKKEKQRDRLTDAEYAAMTPDERKLRDLQLNKVASQKSRVKTKTNRQFKSQVCTAQESDNRALDACAGGLGDAKKLLIETLLAKGLTSQDIIDILRTNGKSESFIMSLFSNHDN